MINLGEQLIFAKSEPKEADKNIDNSKSMGVSPDVYKDNKEIFETEASILKMYPKATNSVSTFGKQSIEHMSLIKNELKTLSQVDNIFTKSVERQKNIALEDKLKVLNDKLKIDPNNLTEEETIQYMEYEEELNDRKELDIGKPNPNEEIVNKYFESKKEINLFDATANKLKAESAQAVGTLYQTPELAYDLYFYPVNLLRKLKGEPEITSKGSWVESPIAKKFNELATDFRSKVPEITGGIYDNVTTGNFEDAGANLAINVAGALPNLATMLTTSFLAGPNVAAGLMGVTSATQKNVESQEKGFTPTESLPNALATGSIEVAMERTGTLAIFKRLETDLVARFGKETSKKVLKPMFYNMLKGGAGEFKEEALTSIAQDLTDYVSGINKDALTNIGTKAIDAGITGFATGAGMVAPGAALSAKVKSQNLENQEKAVRSLLVFGDIKNAMDVYKNTEVANSTQSSDFLKKILDVKNITDVYLNKENLEKFVNTPEKQDAVKKIIDPTGTLHAKINSDIRVNAHEFFPLVLQFPELLDQVKLSPEELSVQEAKDYLYQVEAADKARMGILETLNVPNPTPEDTKMIEEALDPKYTEETDLVGEAAYLDMKPLDKLVTPYLTKAEKSKYLEDQMKSKQEIADWIQESAEYELNKVVDASLETYMGAELEAQLQRVENSPHEETIQRFLNPTPPMQFEYLNETKLPHHKEGYSVFAIDPRTLPENLKHLEKDPRLKKYKVFVKGGMDANRAAGILGYKNVNNLLTNLSQTPTREEIAEQRTKAREADIKQNLKDSIGLNELAITKAYDNRILNALETMKIMKNKFWSSTKIGFKAFMKTPTIKMVKDDAVKTISKTLIKHLNVTQYKRGERRSERIAADSITTNQVEKGFNALNAIAQNIALAQATQIAIGETNRAIRFFKNFKKPSVIEELKEAGDIYHDAAMEILSVFDLTTKKDSKYKDKFNEYVKQVAAGKYVSNFKIPDYYADQRVSVSDMSFEQVMEMKTILKQILHTARYKNKLSIKHEKIKELKTIEKIGNYLKSVASKVYDYNTDQIRIKQESEKGKLDSISDTLALSRNYLERTQHIIRKLDKGEVTGIYNDLFWRPLVDASNAKKQMIDETRKQIDKIVEAFGKDKFENLANEFVVVEDFKGKNGLNASGRVSKSDLLAMELNFGNEGNLQALEEFGIDRKRLREILDEHLTHEHTAFVQNIWDMYSSFKPKMQDLQKRTEGIEVKWVEGKEFTARGRVYPGGYYPIARLAPFGKIKAQEAIGVGVLKTTEDFKNKYYGDAMTEQGHLKSRTESKDPLNLSLDVMGRSFNQTIHDLTHREMLDDSIKLLTDKNIRETIGSVVGKYGYDNIVDTVIRIAEETEADYDNNPIFKFLSWSNRGIQVVALGGKLSSAMMQPASLGLAVQAMGTNGLENILKTTTQLSKNPHLIYSFYDLAEKINPAISKFTEDISKNPAAAMNDLVSVKADKLDKLINARDKYIFDNAFWMLSQVDKVNKVVVTLSAYQQAMDGKVEGNEDKKGDHDFAKKYASNITELTQTSNDIRNMSPVQRDKLGKLFTLFFNDVNNIYNVAIGSYRKMRQEFKDSNKLNGVVELGQFVLVLSAMKAWENIIKGRAIPGDEEDEKDLKGLTKAWGKFMFWQSADMMVGTIPIARDLKYAFGKYKDRPVQVSLPFFSMATDVVTTIGSLTDLFGFYTDLYDADGNITPAEERAIYNTTGFFFRLPTGAFYKYFIQEEIDSNYLKITPLERLQNNAEEFKKVMNNGKIDMEVNKIIEQINPKPLEMSVADQIILEQNLMKPIMFTNEKQVYFNEKQWETLKEENPMLGLTENGRDSSNSKQRDKAFDFLITRNSKMLVEKGLEPSVENLTASHMFGASKAISILSKKDDVKLNKIIDDKSLTEYEIPLDFTVGEFKDWLLLKSMESDEALTNDIKK